MPANTAMQHGTYAGYQKHLHHRTAPCADCSEAAAAYQRKWRADKAKGANVPAVLLGALYVNAPLELQKLAEEILGADRLAHYVARYDAGEVIAA